MSNPISAIYTDGQLRLLEPVDLVEGQQIQVVILSEHDQLRAALGDLLVTIPETSSDDLDEAALALAVEAAFHNQTPLSQTIIEERRTGP